VEKNERELHRTKALASVFAGRLTMTAAVDLMSVARRPHKMFLIERLLRSDQEQ
jgi:hypothetical protein